MNHNWTTLQIGATAEDSDIIFCTLCARRSTTLEMHSEECRPLAGPERLNFLDEASLTARSVLAYAGEAECKCTICQMARAVLILEQLQYTSNHPLRVVEVGGALILSGDLHAYHGPEIRKALSELPKGRSTILSYQMTLDPAAVTMWIKVANECLTEEHSPHYFNSQLSHILQHDPRYAHKGSTFEDPYT